MKPQAHIKWWQWPNVTALDAAAIAISWQWVFATSTGTHLSIYTYLILGISVWLTYMADRLFDVKQCMTEQLLSNRHQFAKKYQTKLWRCWWCLLCVDVGIALYGLTMDELRAGICLMVVCLLYTFANQRLSSRFFPKEICVALIFTGGVAIFQKTAIDYLALLVFALLCLASCLTIGHKEHEVDKALRVKSIATQLSSRWTWSCALFALLLCVYLPPPLSLSMSISLIALSVTYALRDALSVESFRIQIDTSLLYGVIPVIVAEIIN